MQPPASTAVPQLAPGQPSASRPRPSSWFILTMLFVFSVVTYLDRVNISIAAKYIRPEFGLSNVEMGWIFSAFLFGYALLQVPGGWLADHFGPRRVLTIAVSWWSVFTALTALAERLPLASLTGVLGSLIAVRLLIGIGEGIAIPTYNRVIANWAPGTKAASASSLVIGGLGFGGAVAPPFIAFIMERLGWRASFYVCALVGLAAAALWYRFSTDRPPIAEDKTLREERPGAACAPSNDPTPWARILSSSNVWLITGCQFCAGYVINVYIAWFYLYLVDIRGFTELTGAFYTSAPFLAIAILSPLSGVLSDSLSKRLGRRRGRQLTALGSMCAAALTIFVGDKVADPYVAIAMLSLGAGLSFSMVTSVWAAIVDIAGRHAGTVTGITTMGANVGGAFAPILTPLIARSLGWTAALDCAAVLAFVGGLLWLPVNPDREQARGSL